MGKGTNDGWTKVPSMGHFFVSTIFHLVPTKDLISKDKENPMGVILHPTIV